MPEPRAPSPRSIYVVDDSDSIRRSLPILLTAMGGFAVETFASGPAFLAVAPGLAPGCILLDRNLDGASGFDVLARLAHSANAFAVVMTSGAGGDGLFLRALRAGAIDFLAKPFAVPDLARAIDRALDHLLDPGIAAAARRRLLTLPADTLDVVVGLAAGRTEVEIAGDNGMSPAGVAACRAAAMRVFDAASFHDLMRAVFAGGIAVLLPPLVDQG